MMSENNPLPAQRTYQIGFDGRWLNFNFRGSKPLFEWLEPPSDPSKLAYWKYLRSIESTFPQDQFNGDALRRNLENGITLFHIAVLTDNLQNIPNSLLTPALFAIKDDNGTTPLHLAAEFDKLHRIPGEVLAHCDFNVQDNKGITPLGLSIYYETYKSIPKGAISVEHFCTRDNDGVTPLHLAMSAITPLRDLIEENKHLIELRLDEVGQFVSLRDFIAAALIPQCMSVKDNKGITPLHLAMHHFEALRDSIAESLMPECMTIEDNAGFSPLDWAGFNCILHLLPQVFHDPKYFTPQRYKVAFELCFIGWLDFALLEGIDSSRVCYLSPEDIKAEALKELEWFGEYELPPDLQDFICSNWDFVQ